MLALIVEYGPSVLAWVLAGLGALLAKYVFARLKAGYARDVLSRAAAEVSSAVLATFQRYVSRVKEASGDGTLTDEEKAKAMADTIAEAKANLGSRLLKSLARILGANLDGWLETQAEAAVALGKAPGGPLTLPAPASPR